MSDSIIIIPTYNEKENIEKLFALFSHCQRRSTFLLLTTVRQTAPPKSSNNCKRIPKALHLIERTGKLVWELPTLQALNGFWNTTTTIFLKWTPIFASGAQTNGTLRCCAEKGFDVAIGSRYVGNVVNVVNWPMGRVLMSHYASKYVRFITGLKITDTTAGFVCYRREVLKTIDFDKIRFKGYAFQIEMKFTAHKCGFKLTEVPIVFVNRAEAYQQNERRHL